MAGKVQTHLPVATRRSKFNIPLDDPAKTVVFWSLDMTMGASYSFTVALTVTARGLDLEGNRGMTVLEECKVYYTPTEAARLLSLPFRTLQSRIRNGLIVVERHGARTVLISAQEVERMRGLGPLKRGPKPRRGRDQDEPRSEPSGLPPLIARLNATRAALSGNHHFECAAEAIQAERADRTP